MSRRRAFRVLLALCAALAATLIAELVLRAAGYAPWRPIAVRHDEPTIHEPDPELGWRNQEGRYVFAAWAAGSPDVRMQLWADGARATSAERAPRERRLVLVGCSYTQGWAVSDEETYAWKLQEALPDVEIVNYGTAGYNPLQCLIALERHFARGGKAELVLFGLATNHAERVTARPGWLETLARAARRGHVEVPSASIEDGRLVRHAPIGYPLLPLREHSALVTRVQGVLAGLRHRGQDERSADIVIEVVRAMQATAERNGARFGVALLGWPPYADDYARRLERAGVACVRCDLTDARPEDYVPGEGHPGPTLHARWTETLLPWARERIR